MKKGPDYGKELKLPFSVGGKSLEQGQICGNEKENKKKKTCCKEFNLVNIYTKDWSSVEVKLRNT